MGIERPANIGIMPGTALGTVPQIPLVPGTPGANVIQSLTPPVVPVEPLTLVDMEALPLVTVVGAALVARLHGFQVPRSSFAVGPFAMSRPVSLDIDGALRRRLNYVGERPHAVSFRIREANVLFHDESPLLEAARVYLLPDLLRRPPDTNVDELTAMREALTKWPGHRAEVLRFYRPESIAALGLAAVATSDTPPSTVS